MMNFFKNFLPVVSKKSFNSLAKKYEELEHVERENFHLRGAIRLANEELQRHRRLLNGLATGHSETTEQFERVMNLKK